MQLTKSNILYNIIGLETRKGKAFFFHGVKSLVGNMEKDHDGETDGLKFRRH